MNRLITFAVLASFIFVNAVPAANMVFEFVPVSSDWGDTNNWDTGNLPGDLVGDNAIIQSDSGPVDVTNAFASAFPFDLILRDGETLNIGANMSSFINLRVGYNTAHFGMVNHSAGTVQTTNLFVGSANGGAASNSYYHLSGSAMLGVSESILVYTQGVLNLSGGTLRVDQDATSFSLRGDGRVVMDSGTFTTTGSDPGDVLVINTDFEISGGIFDQDGQIFIGDNTPAEFKIIGDDATITMERLNLDAGGESATLNFVLDETGVSTISLSSWMNLRNATLLVDGAAYTGGTARILLLDSVNLVNTAGAVTVNGFSSDYNAVVNQITDDGMDWVELLIVREAVYSVTTNWSSIELSDDADVFIRSNAVVTLDHSDTVQTLTVNDEAAPITAALNIADDHALTVTSSINIGAGTGAGIINQSTGSVTTATLAINASGSGDLSQYNLSGGALNIGDALVTRNAGHFNVSGGRVDIQGGLFLQSGATNTISGGELHTPLFEVGAGGSGTLALNGGALVLPRTGGFRVLPGGLLDIDGGLLSKDFHATNVVGTTIQDGDGTILIQSGALQFTNGTVFSGLDLYCPMSISGGDVDIIGQFRIRDEMTVIGDDATIDIRNLNALPDASLVFQLDETGVSALNVMEWCLLELSGITVDGSAYTGPPQTMTLIDSLSLASVSTNVSVFGFTNGLSAHVVQDQANGKDWVQLVIEDTRPPVQNGLNHFVNVNSLNPQPPYTNWATAATVIQDAVDAASSGDRVLVTNGVYTSVSIAGDVTLESVNGAEATVIDGGGSNRCVIMSGGAAIRGFLVRNGFSPSGSGVHCTSTNEVVVDCTLSGNVAENSGGGALDGTLNNCVIISNSARYGGGVYRCVLNDCTLSGNTAAEGGGGACFGILNRCTISRNSAVNGGGTLDVTLSHCTLSGNSAVSGGGTYRSTLVDCTLTGNLADNGGGACLGVLTNCILSGNTATVGGGVLRAILSHCTLSGNAAFLGGGAFRGTLNNCVLTENAASFGGGANGSTLSTCTITENTAELHNNVGGIGAGTYSCTLNNCTITDNSAELWGGGANASVLNNCILYHNRARAHPNHYFCTIRYSCTSPDPGGAGNIAADPGLMSSTRIRRDSPCVGKGNSEHASGADIDGEPWRTVPAMGADEPYADSGGLLLVDIRAPYTSVSAGVEISFTALVDGALTATAWDFGDETVVSNAYVSSHSWSNTGTYEVSLTAWNADHPEGVSTTLMVQVEDEVTLYVNAASPAPQAPYSDWSTAAHTIQDAIDAVEIPGSRILVTNGVYASGGAAVFGGLTNRVALSNAVRVISVNGPGVTMIRGASPDEMGPLRCAYVGDDSLLSGFTLTGGSTLALGDLLHETSGGGAFCEIRAVIHQCVLTGNSALRGAGGGVVGGTLNSCTITDNIALSGGGATSSTLNNCIVYHNQAQNAPNHDFCTVRFSCTTPGASGPGNISIDPGLLSSTRIHRNSPCVGSASVEYASEADIDGELWRPVPPMGVDEPYADSRGPLEVAIRAPYRSIVVGVEMPFTALIDGTLTETAWDYGDKTIVSNAYISSHVWTNPGTYEVSLTAWNTDHPEGVSTTLMVQVEDEVTLYVSAESSDPQAPYADWSTAAHTIQDAIDAVTLAGSRILVTNGVYATGGAVLFGSLTNRVALTNAVRVKSINGPGLTVIEGAWDPVASNGPAAVRCAYVGKGARLSGFTLTNGATLSTVGTWGDFVTSSGGGLWSEIDGVSSNCVVTGNVANNLGGGVYGGALNDSIVRGNWAGSHGGGAALGTFNRCTIRDNAGTSGGGAYLSTLNHCVLSGNSARQIGGGGYFCQMNNCTLSGNWAAGPGGGANDGTLTSCLLVGNSSGAGGGGAFRSRIRNCTLTENEAGSSGGGVGQGSVVRNSILYYNTATEDGQNFSDASVSESCSFPLPEGLGNITNVPQFGDPTAGDYRLKPTSPCVDTGAVEDSMFSQTDLEGAPRILGAGVDMGAYEFRFESTLRLSLAHMKPFGRAATNAHVALTSPYAPGNEPVAAVNSNIIDWVILSLRPSIDGVPDLLQPLLLRNDGQVVMPDGSETVYLEGKGHNHLVFKHRNHLAVATPTAVTTNRVFSYDFTTGPDKYYGTNNACIQVNTNLNLWGMIPGDADADGRITHVDWLIVSNSLGKTGYLQADLNLDGVVSSNDLSVSKW